MQTLGGTKTSGTDGDMYYGSWGESDSGGLSLKTVHWNIANILGVTDYSFVDYDYDLRISLSSSSEETAAVSRPTKKRAV